MATEEDWRLKPIKVEVTRTIGPPKSPRPQQVVHGVNCRCVYLPTDAVDTPIIVNEKEHADEAE